VEVVGPCVGRDVPAAWWKLDDCPLRGWDHVAVVWRDRQPTLYLNGVFEKAGCRGGITLVYQGQHHTLYFNDALEKGDPHNERAIHPLFNLGGVESGWFQGKLADVRVYDRARGDAEIQQLAVGKGWTAEDHVMQNVNSKLKDASLRTSRSSFLNLHFAICTDPTSCSLRPPSKFLSPAWESRRGGPR
jgi:hypothetical protein